MIRLLMALLFIVIIPCSVLAEEKAVKDYVLKIEVRGFVDAPLTSPEPKEEIFRSVEILVREGVPFRSRTRMGSRTLLLQGLTEAKGKSQFIHQVKVVDSDDTGLTVPLKDGGTEPILDITSAATTVVSELGAEVLIGGSVVTWHNAISPDGRQSKSLFFLLLTENVEDDKPVSSKPME